MRKFSLPFILILLTLACAIPGAAAPEPLPTFDPNLVQTVIVETGAAAQTQTAINLPTSTKTPTPTRTPSLTPTSTPTFLFFLPSFTPIPSITPFPTITFTSLPPDEDAEPTKKPKRDPLAMTGREWTCSVLGTFPPQGREYKQKTKFTVQWEVFNSGTKSWPYFGLDLVYTGGYRHEETRIQDFARSVPSGGRILLDASFITPKLPGEYNTYFTLMVGSRRFCHMIYSFVVVEDK